MGPHGADDDEPGYVFLGRDALLLQLLSYYYNVCGRAGSPPEYLQQIARARARIAAWQQVHPDRVKVPDAPRLVMPPPHWPGITEPVHKRFREEYVAADQLLYRLAEHGLLPQAMAALTAIEQDRPPT